LIGEFFIICPEIGLMALQSASPATERAAGKATGAAGERRRARAEQPARERARRLRLADPISMPGL
jgi:hypothetical protein